MTTAIFSANYLEQKRLERRAAASLRLEQKLAQRLHQGADCSGTHAPILQGSSAHPVSESATASTSIHAAAPQSGAESVLAAPQAAQFVQSGLLP